MFLVVSLCFKHLNSQYINNFSEKVDAHVSDYEKWYPVTVHLFNFMRNGEGCQNYFNYCSLWIRFAIHSDVYSCLRARCIVKSVASHLYA